MKLRLLAIHHHGHIVWVGGVAAEQAVLAEQPEVAGLRDRLLGQRRDVVRVGKPAVLVEAVEQLLQLALVEAEEVEVAALVA